MTENNDAGASLAAFLAEHGRCWKLSGADLKTWEADLVVGVRCPGCDALLTMPKYSG